MMVGVSFSSGADDALFFDKLGFDKDSHEWRKLVARGSVVSLIASPVVTVVGGWLHTINPRIPWLLTAAAFVVSALVIWDINNERPDEHPSERSRFLGYIGDIRSEFAQFRRPVLRIYIPVIITVQGVLYATDWGLLKLVLLSRFGFSPFAGALVIASVSLVTAAGLALVNRHSHRLSEKRVLACIMVSVAASLAFSVLPLGVAGALVYLTLYSCEYIMFPFMSEVINKHAIDQQRATILSVASFLKTAPYVILGPLIGALNTAGHVEIFLLGWPVVIAASLAYYLVHKKRDTSVEVTLD